MIAPTPAREIIKKFTAAGFTSRPGKGSHAVWTCPSGEHSFALPQGHRTISAGVHRNAIKVINGCTCRRGQR